MAEKKTERGEIHEQIVLPSASTVHRMPAAFSVEFSNSSFARCLPRSMQKRCKLPSRGYWPRLKTLSISIHDPQNIREKKRLIRVAEFLSEARLILAHCSIQKASTTKWGKTRAGDKQTIRHFPAFYPNLSEVLLFESFHYFIFQEHLHQSEPRASKCSKTWELHDGVVKEWPIEESITGKIWILQIATTTMVSQWRFATTNKKMKCERRIIAVPSQTAPVHLKSAPSAFEKRLTMSFFTNRSLTAVDQWVKTARSRGIQSVNIRLSCWFVITCG